MRLTILPMPFDLAYDLGPASYLAHRKLTDRSGLRAFRNGFWIWCGLLAGVSLLGLVAAGLARSLPLLVVFCVTLVSIVFEAATWRRRYKAIITNAVARMPVLTVALRVDDQGLHESVAGVESFAPWNAVKSYAASSDTVALELASGSWSVIPAIAFGSTGESSLAAFLALLGQKGVPARTA